MDSKSSWFQDARFGLFLHWGLYAIPARGEWSYARDDWKPGEYESLMKVFDPTDYDPAQWARLAKAAGMKYVVLTTRHHDGFCMFDSHYSDYKITNTPYGKDVTRMLVEAFRAEGLRVGFYHSLPDWTHPGYADEESPEYIRFGELHVPTAEERQAYRDLLYNHVEQLMTEYGKIDLLFFDYTSKTKAGEDYFDRERLLEMVYRHQPDILVNDRLSYFKDIVRDFDYYTPETAVLNRQQTVKGRPVVWETCATMNNHWGYCDTDTDYKSLETLTSGLMGCVSQNGNLLLNIGPEPTGKFPPQAVRTLEELASWFRVNGEAVTGCGKAEFPAPHGFTCAQKGNVLYLYCMAPPMGDIILPKLRGRVESIVHLRTGNPGTCIDHWGFELLQPDDQRIRCGGIRPGDVLKLVLKEKAAAPFTVRQASLEDFNAMLGVYAAARQFMRTHGNPNQWGDRKPLPEEILQDIRNGNSYLVCLPDGTAAGCFSFIPGIDETYNYIEGQWLRDRPYAAMHKVASAGIVKGVFGEILRFCESFGIDLRIDTHHDNIVMQSAVQKFGFTRCGIIYLKDGDPRIAYQKCIEKA